MLQHYIFDSMIKMLMKHSILTLSLVEEVSSLLVKLEREEKKKRLYSHDFNLTA